MEMSASTAEILGELRRRGYLVIGPQPVSLMGGPPVPGGKRPSPGAHVQIAYQSRLVEGFGADADEAVRDALVKLRGIRTGGAAGG
jgi:hypothetical protein